MVSQAWRQVLPYGVLHMGFTQGLLATLVADTAPPELRGTAYGMFNLLSGLGASYCKRARRSLVESVGPESTFLRGRALYRHRSRRSGRYRRIPATLLARADKVIE